MPEFLNYQFRPCRKPEAYFSESLQAAALFDLPTQEKVENLLKTKSPAPVGEGLPGDEILLGPSQEKFLWNVSGYWENKSQSRNIQILPNCDKEDAGSWILAFSPIDEKILRRGLADKKPITFTLGARFDKDFKNVGFTNSETRQIGFSQSRNGNNLLCTLLEEATAKDGKPITLQMLILHEVGHLLEKYLEKPMGELIGSFPNNHTKALPLLAQISPQYLEAEWASCQKLFQILEEKKQRGETTVKIKGWDEPLPLTTFEKTQREEYCREILAELVRVIYLDPSVTNSIPIPVETGWKELDDLAQTIQKEAIYNLKKGCLEKSPFPQETPKKITHLGIEEIEP